MQEHLVKTPFHLWLIGILAVLWNAIGAFDYTATQMQMDFYMSQFSEQQLAYFYGFPAWVDAAWAIAVWSSLLGSLMLLFRKALAAWLFGLAILGMIGTSVYNLVLTNGLEVMGDGSMTFTVVIWVIALLLYFYAVAMVKRRVLT
ncbi:MAG: hypothetical protein KJN78_06045 [Gammaproteobacteria bacterium]|nr:hypothetical protein [Gammaproteobacteria bacterium]